MPVILYISRFCLELQGNFRIFPEFFRMRVSTRSGQGYTGRDWMPHVGLGRIEGPTGGGAHVEEWDHKKQQVTMPSLKRNLSRFPIPCNYIALRHQAVVSMLKNLVLSPRER